MAKIRIDVHERRWGRALHTTVEPARDARRQETPAERLAAAVVAQALVDHAAGRADAREWIASSDRGPFSFCWFCTELGLDDGYLRLHVGDVVRARLTR